MMGFAPLNPSYELPQVNRVLDLRHASKMEQVETALATLGLRLIVDVAKAARFACTAGEAQRNPPCPTGSTAGYAPLHSSYACYPHIRREAK